MKIKNVTASTFFFDYNDEFYGTPGYTNQQTIPGNNTITTIPSERIRGAKYHLDPKLQTGEYIITEEHPYDQWVFRPTVGILLLSGNDELIPRYLDPLGGGGGGGGGDTVEIEQRVITVGEANAGSLNLLNVPTSIVLMSISGGVQPVQGADFTVGGAVIDWSLGGLFGVLSSGETVTFFYKRA